MFTLKAPAKINWFLSVLRKREDGYHDIASLVQSVSLYDYLAFEYSDEIKIIAGDGIPMEENLVYKAAVLLRESCTVKKGALITLKKNIPVSAGLGGGSSDAACALKGLNKLWDLGMGDDELIKLGGTLGSDIPFFFRGPFALIEGRGELVTPLKADISYALLLVKPPFGVSAKWAYAEISSLLPELTKKDNNIKIFSQAIEKQDYKSIAFMLRNDLEIPVAGRYRAIAEIKDRLIAMGARASLMSGSGPTVFGIFDDSKTAEKAAQAMKPNWCSAVETII